MLLPRRIKYRRQHRPETTGRSKGGNFVTFSEYGLQAITISWITSRQIESAHTTMTRYMKRGGEVWIKIFPHTSHIKKPLEVRMGAGRGAVEGWIAAVKPGCILPEIAGVSEDMAREVSRLTNHKPPVKIKFVKREKLSDETNEG